jgi:peptide/nickel transport system permease protein
MPSSSTSRPEAAWSVLAPVLIIGLFTIGTNLTADGIAQLNDRGGSDS